jgi:hypothetical protein
MKQDEFLTMHKQREQSIDSTQQMMHACKKGVVGLCSDGRNKAYSVAWMAHLRVRVEKIRKIASSGLNSNAFGRRFASRLKSSISGFS